MNQSIVSSLPPGQTHRRHPSADTGHVLSSSYAFYRRTDLDLLGWTCRERKKRSTSSVSHEGRGGKRARGKKEDVWGRDARA